MCGPLPPGPLNPPDGRVCGVSVDMALSKSEAERGALASVPSWGLMKVCQAAPGMFEMGLSFS